MQCFKVFLADELFHFFDIKVTDPVIEVSDPKNHTNMGSTEIRHENVTIDIVVDYMSHNPTSGSVVVGEMRTVTLSTWTSVLAIDRFIGMQKSVF